MAFLNSYKMEVIRKFVRHGKGVDYSDQPQVTVPSCVDSLRQSLEMFTQNGLSPSVLQGNLQYDGDTTDVPDELDLQGDLTDIQKVRRYVKGKRNEIVQDYADKQDINIEPPTPPTPPKDLS